LSCSYAIFFTYTIEVAPANKRTRLSEPDAAGAAVIVGASGSKRSSSNPEEAKAEVKKAAEASSQEEAKSISKADTTTVAIVAVPGVSPPATAKPPAPPVDPFKGNNRLRLPDKIMKCIMEGIEPEVLWWSPHENGFAFDPDLIQEKILNVQFRGTKLTSFIRGLNRWCVYGGSLYISSSQLVLYLCRAGLHR